MGWFTAGPYLSWCYGGYICTSCISFYLKIHILAICERNLPITGGCPHTGLYIRNDFPSPCNDVIYFMLYSRSRFSMNNTCNRGNMINSLSLIALSSLRQIMIRYTFVFVYKHKQRVMFWYRYMTIYVCNYFNSFYICRTSYIVCIYRYIYIIYISVYTSG